jgi:hypothetical protein
VKKQKKDKFSPTLLCKGRGQIAKKIPLFPPFTKGEGRGIFLALWLAAF